MGSKGIVASTAAMAVLLQEGIGDTIRVSLTPEPDGDRTQEVVVAQEILQTMGLRSFTPMVTACPGCGRTTSTYFQELAERIQQYLRDVDARRGARRYPGVEEMHVAVMGCVVNGPGESKLANVGISLPGTGETPVAPVYVDGEKTVTLKGERIAEEFQQIVDEYVRATYGGETVDAAPEGRAEIDRGQGGRVTGANDVSVPLRGQAGTAQAGKLQAVRGMNDVLPDEAALWERFEDTDARRVRAVRLPQHARADRRADAAVRARRSAKSPTSSRRRCTRSTTAQRREPDAAPGGDRRHRARGDRAQPDSTNGRSASGPRARCSATSGRRRAAIASSTSSTSRRSASRARTSTPSRS